MAHGVYSRWAQLASYQCNDPIKIHNLIKIHDIVDLAAKHPNATHRHELILQGTRDGWLMGQDDQCFGSHLSIGKLYVWLT